MKIITNYLILADSHLRDEMRSIGSELNERKTTNKSIGNVSERFIPMASIIIKIQLIIYCVGYWNKFSSLFISSELRLWSSNSHMNIN